MMHIPTELHEFLISSFRDFVRTVTQTDAEGLPSRSMHAGNDTKTVNQQQQQQQNLNNKQRPAYVADRA